MRVAPAGKVSFLGGSEYRPIDYGDTLMLDSDAKRGLGRFGNKEVIQCAITHLSTALLWLARGREDKIPNRAEIFPHATHQRREEILIAIQMKEVKNAASSSGKLTMCQARDALGNGHGRDFRWVDSSFSLAECGCAETVAPTDFRGGDTQKATQYRCACIPEWAGGWAPVCGFGCV